MMDGSLIEHVNAYLNERRFEDVIRIISIQERKQELVEKGLDLIPIVCKHLSRKNAEDIPDLECYCDSILSELARTGNAKEILIGLLEQADHQEDDTKFKALLRPIQIVLERLPTKRDKTLEWVLSVLYSHVSSLPLPKAYNFEERERKLLELDPETQRITNVLSSLISFYEPFVTELSFSSTLPLDFYGERNHWHRNKLTYFLLQLLDCPLVFLDLSHKNGEAKSALYVIAEQLVAYIKQLQSNFYNLFALYSQMYQPAKKLKIDKISCADVHEESYEKISDLALATFFYLVFAEGIEFAHLPCVYTHIYVVESCLPFVNAMLKRSEECIMHKGILLALALTKKIRDRELGVIMLEFSQHLMFAQNLINVMLHSQIQEFRKEAVQLLQQYIAKYDSQGRYQLLKCLLSKNQHAGVQGLLIQNYKNNLNESICCEPVLPYFIGSNLQAMLSIIAKLPDGSETDVLDQSDRILGTLNFIRFLALRDHPNRNVTGFWNLAKVLEVQYLKPLRTALDLSRAHYQLELKGLQENQEEDLPSNFMFRVPPEQSEQVLKLALNTFDVIDSVVTRILELL